MANIEYKINCFRAKYEQDLRKLVTQGCCVASCTNDGMAEQEEIEMNDFAGRVLSLIERHKRTNKRTTKDMIPLSGNVTSICKHD